jgi:hypothetical protein
MTMTSSSSTTTTITTTDRQTYVEPETYATGEVDLKVCRTI